VQVAYVSVHLLFCNHYNYVRDTRDLKNIETRAVIKSPPPMQGVAPKEIHAILTEILACLVPGRAKDLSAPLY